MIDINKYFTDKYKWLKQTAINNLGKIQQHKMADELVTDCYLHLTTIDLSNKKENEIDAIVVNFMYRQIVWNNTGIKKRIPKDNTIINEYNTPDISLSEEEILEKEMEHQDKLNHIQVYSQGLNLDQRILFDVVYTQGYNNSGKLARHTGLSRTTCYNLIKNLRNQIKTAYTNKL